MIVPSIDLMNGKAVQLVGGRKKKIDAGDPRPIAERFRLAGEIAVVDLDAALGRGSNADVIHDLIEIAPCRVGGGIRDVDSALRWLDAGAVKIVLGTAATPEVVGKLPRDRVVAALDAVHGEVVVKGWREKTGCGIVERMEELREHVGSFLVTFVEREGRMEGIDLAQVKSLLDPAAGATLTIAGGVTTTDEIAALDALGCEAQVGMALYSGSMSLAAAIAAPMKSDRSDGLWPTIVTDERGVALGLAWSNLESLEKAVQMRRGVYHSRSRGLWIKGESSGATQDLRRVDLDCDRDALRFIVRQHGAGFCHRETYTCWGDNDDLGRLYRRIAGRMETAPDGSYTKRLFEDDELLKAKLVEEAHELADATAPDEVRWEASDVLYFALVAMARAGVRLEDVERELARRALQVLRRKGDAKPRQAEARP